MSAFLYALVAAVVVVCAACGARSRPSDEPLTAAVRRASDPVMPAVPVSMPAYEFVPEADDAVTVEVVAGISEMESLLGDPTVCLLMLEQDGGAS